MRFLTSREEGYEQVHQDERSEQTDTVAESAGFVSRPRRPRKWTRCVCCLLAGPLVVFLVLGAYWAFANRDLPIPWGTKIWIQAVNLGWADADQIGEVGISSPGHVIVGGMGMGLKESGFERLARHIDALVCAHRSAEVFLVHGSKLDAEAEGLESWRRNFQCPSGSALETMNFYFSGPDLPTHSFDKYAWLRNYLLAWVRKTTSHPTGTGTAFVLIDLDAHAFDVEEVLRAAIAVEAEDPSATASPSPLGAICANGVIKAGEYRDRFAHVEIGQTKLAQMLTAEQATSKVWQKERCFSSGVQHGDPRLCRMLPVKSCFGGLAVYNLRAIFDNDCRYQTLEEFREDGDGSYLPNLEGATRICEHITLSRCLYTNGFSLSVSRDMLLFYGSRKDSGNFLPWLKPAWPSLFY